MPAGSSQPRWPLSYWAAVAGVGVVYLLLALAIAVTKRPMGDEVYMANPAVDLITRGTTGVTAIEPTGDSIRPTQVMSGIDRHLYMWLPFPFLVHAGWYKIFGFSVLSMRMVSIMLGFLALGACWLMVWTLCASRGLALLAAALLTVDFAFLSAAADGRPDMMASAFSLAGLAAYLFLRERSLERAALVSQAFQAAGAFSHPNAALGVFGVLFLALWLDRGRIRPRHLVLAAVPHLVFAAGWGLYILQSPRDFLVQFGAALEGRGQGVARLWMGFVNEIKVRYLELSYLPPYARGVGRLRVAIPILYLAAILACAATRSVRAAFGPRVLLSLAALYFVLMALLEGHKNSYYLVHIIPLFVMIFAVWIHRLWPGRPLARVLAVALIAGFTGLQASWAAHAIRANTYRTSYLPIVRFLQQNMSSSSIVMGTMEFAFDLGFCGNFTDDTTLGYYTGKRAEFVIVDERNYTPAFEHFKTTAPKIHEFTKKLLAEEYQRVFSAPHYDVYRRLR